MSSRDSRRSAGDGRRTGRQRTSVVGAKVRDVSMRLNGRGLPRGGIRGQEGLKVAEGALPDSTIIGSVDGRSAARRVLRVVAIISGTLAAILVIVALVVAILSHTSAFAVTSIETSDSEHVSADNVAQLANIQDGVTLLSVNESAIEEGVKKNPWVGAVRVERVFPDRLRIVVSERKPAAIVAMSSGGLAWLLGNDGVWIEPVHVEAAQDESFNDAALAEAQRQGVILISDVPTSVSPVAGSVATDSCIEAVEAFREQLGSSFQEQIASYSAASADDISCILKSGVEVALGSPSNVSAKETVAKRILDEYAGQITYINVRVPSHPTYRRVNSTYVREGTGATGQSVDADNSAAKRDDAPSDGATAQGSDEDGSDVSTYSDADDGAEQGGEYGTDDSGTYGYDYDYDYYDDDGSSDYDEYGTYDSYDFAYDSNDLYDDQYEV